MHRGESISGDLRVFLTRVRRRLRWAWLVAAAQAFFVPLGLVVVGLLALGSLVGWSWAGASL